MAKLAIKIVEASLNNVHVIDGDTVDGELIWRHWLKRSKIQTRVRLAGINAPEMKGRGGGPEPFAQEATNFLTDRVEGKNIKIQFAIHKTTNEWIRESGGNWNNRRLLGILYKGFGDSLNVVLVKEGLAKIYPNPTWMVAWFEKQLEKAKDEAQRKRRGIWGENLVETGGNRVFWFCVGVIAALVSLIVWAS